jgi:hypothetical protein
MSNSGFTAALGFANESTWGTAAARTPDNAITWDHPTAGFRRSAQNRAGSSGGAYGAAAATSSAAVDTWFSFTGTYDGTSVRLYVDGVLEATTAIAPSTAIAETRITLALSGIASAGIVSPDVLDVPPAPDVDDATGEDPWSANIPALLTHVGAYNANYNEDMMGFLINAPAAYLKTDGADSESVTNAYYDEAYTFPSTGFRIQLPGVADTHRQPLEIEVAQSYAVEIPENPLTLEVL